MKWIHYQCHQNIYPIGKREFSLSPNYIHFAKSKKAKAKANLSKTVLISFLSYDYWHNLPVLEWFRGRIWNSAFVLFLGELIFGGGLYSEGAYIRRAFCVSVRVSRPQNSLLYVAILGKKGVSIGQNYLYFAIKPI